MCVMLMHSTASSCGSTTVARCSTAEPADVVLLASSSSPSAVRDVGGHCSAKAAASSSSGAETLGSPRAWAATLPKISGVQSVGCTLRCGNAAARKAECSPVPHATSRRAVVPLTLQLMSCGGAGRYLDSTSHIGCLFLAAAGANIR